MAERVTLKGVNDELARLGYTVRFARASGYLYFEFGEAADWLDRTVNVPTVSSRTIAEWLEEFRRLKKLNEQLIGKTARKPPRSRAPRATN